MFALAIAFGITASQAQVPPSGHSADFEAGYLQAYADARLLLAAQAAGAAPATQSAASQPATGAPSPRMALGVNIDDNSYYGVVPWVDVAHSFTGWYGCKDYTPDGYPLEDAQSMCFMKGTPGGVYKLSYQGTGTIAAQWAMVQHVQKAGDTTTADVLVQTANRQIILIATNIDKAHPIHNLHLIAPGYDTQKPPAVRTEWAQWLKPFGTARCMDLGRINGSTQVHWSDRVQPDNYDQTTHGVAYEYWLALANQQDLDLWVCVPYGADDDYVRQMAALFRALHPGGTIYLELSNEIWNSAPGFGQFKQNWDIANGPATLLNYDGQIINGKVVPYPNPPATDGRTRAARCAAERARHVGYLFREAMGAQRVRVVWAGQCMASDWARSGLEWVDARFGDAAKAFDCVAIAPYWPIDELKNSTTSLPQLAAAYQQFITTGLAAAIQSHSQLARKYGLTLIGYEGGQSCYPWTNPMGGPTDLATRLQTDPLMYNLYAGWLQVCQQNGIALECHDSFIGPWSKSGYWGLMQNVTDSPTPKYKAIADFAGKN